LATRASGVICKRRSADAIALAAFVIRNDCLIAKPTLTKGRLEAPRDINGVV
jgi:hypothetical protein